MATTKKKASKKKTTRKSDQSKMDQAVLIMEKMFVRQSKELKEILPVLMKELLDFGGLKSTDLYGFSQLVAVLP